MPDGVDSPEPWALACTPPLTETSYVEWLYRGFQRELDELIGLRPGGNVYRTGYSFMTNWLN